MVAGELRSLRNQLYEHLPAPTKPTASVTRWQCVALFCAAY